MDIYLYKSRSNSKTSGTVVWGNFLLWDRCRFIFCMEVKKVLCKQWFHLWTWIDIDIYTAVPDGIRKGKPGFIWREPNFEYGTNFKYPISALWYTDDDFEFEKFVSKGWQPKSWVIGFLPSALLMFFINKDTLCLVKWSPIICFAVQRRLNCILCSCMFGEERQHELWASNFAILR